MHSRPTLRRSLEDLGEFSAHHAKDFIPEGLLETFLTKEAIYRLLNRCPAISSEDLTKMVDNVHSKVLKVFATLILIESDGKLLKVFLSKGLWDQKLPFSKEDLGQDLREVLGDKSVDDFLHKQHMFLTPIFFKGINYGPMDSKYILPFKENIYISEGAFGMVYKIQIHANHQRLQASSDGSYKAKWFARKEFKITPDCERKFEREKRNLQLLLKLNHPNIVPLLATYSHDGYFNMIFPLADMTLHDYLRSSRCSDDNNRSTISLFRKVYDLAKALHDIHNPSFEEDDGKESKFLGYHHDLKPRNILVLNGSFMIADFGLANLKNIDQSSKTASGVGRGAYCPPEVMIGIPSHGRASDIWSFGCILIEFVTFDVMGAKGVEDFARYRTTEVSTSMTNDYFHDGSKVKPEVLQHLRELKSKAIDRPGSQTIMIISQILELAEQMLEPVISRRPSSGAVLEKFGKILDTASLGTSKSHQTENLPAPQSPLSRVYPPTQSTSSALVLATNKLPTESTLASQMEAGNLSLMTKDSEISTHPPKQGLKPTSNNLATTSLWTRMFFLVLCTIALIGITGFHR